MAINVADNFSYKGGKPLDARIKYDTITAMVNTPTADLYDGCLAYVTAEKKNYQYDSSNAVDPTLGKWRELETGGGGTTYTAGDGIDIANDIISVDEMPDTDMSEIVTPLPSVMSRRMNYSSDEQIIGEWIDGKPIYQKTVSLGALPNATSKNVAHEISNLGIVINIVAVGYNSSGQQIPLNFAPIDNTANACNIRIMGANININSGIDRSGFTGYCTLQYTKTS